MSILDSLSYVIDPTVPKYAFVLDNGTILRSTMSEDNVLKLTKFLHGLCDKLKIGSYIHKSKLYIFRLSEHFLIFLLTDHDEEPIQKLLKDINQRFSLKIKRIYAEMPKTFKNIVKTIIFSMALMEGPEPVIWTSSDMDEAEIFRISMKSLLNLTGELHGAKKRMISFQPFISHDALGVIYLFQIPHEVARGSSFDSSFTLLVNYNERAIVYEKNTEIEHILSKYAEKYISKIRPVLDDNGRISNKEELMKNLQDLEKEISEIPMVELESEHIMHEMMKSLREIKKL